MLNCFCNSLQHINAHHPRWHRDSSSIRRPRNTLTNDSASHGRPPSPLRPAILNPVAKFLSGCQLFTDPARMATEKQTEQIEDGHSVPRASNTVEAAETTQNSQQRFPGTCKTNGCEGNCTPLSVPSILNALHLLEMRITKEGSSSFSATSEIRNTMARKESIMQSTFTSAVRIFSSVQPASEVQIKHERKLRASRRYYE